MRHIMSHIYNETLVNISAFIKKNALIQISLSLSLYIP